MADIRTDAVSHNRLVLFFGSSNDKHHKKIITNFCSEREYAHQARSFFYSVALDDLSKALKHDVGIPIVSNECDL